MSIVTKRAAVYARAAPTLEQSLSFTMDEQVRKCKEYAKSKGYKLTDLVYQEVISGSSQSKAVILRAIEDASQGKFDILIIHDFDILSQKIELLLISIYQFEVAGVQVESVKEGFFAFVSNNSPLLSKLVFYDKVFAGKER